MFERFTRDARTVVVSTQDLCATLGADEVRPVHLLLALTEEGNGARDLLAAHGITDGCRRRRPRRPAARRRRPRWATTTPRRCARSASTSTPSGRPSTASSARGRSREPGSQGRRRSHRRGRRRATTTLDLARRRFGVGGHVRFGRGAKKVLELSLREAIRAARPRDPQRAHRPRGAAHRRRRRAGCCSARSASTCRPCAPTSRAAAAAAPEPGQRPGFAQASRRSASQVVTIRSAGTPSRSARSQP